MSQIDKLRERLEALKAGREQYVTDANRTIGEYNGRIAELEEIITQLHDRAKKLEATKKLEAMDATDELRSRERTADGLMAKG